MIEAQKDMAIASLNAKTDTAVELAKQSREEFAIRLAQGHEATIKSMDHAHERLLAASQLADTANARVIETAESAAERAAREKMATKTARTKGRTKLKQ